MGDDEVIPSVPAQDPSAIIGQPDVTGWFSAVNKGDNVFYVALATPAHVLVLPLRFGSKVEADLFLDTHVLGKDRISTEELLAIEVPV
jgi:hypothetical protein